MSKMILRTTLLGAFVAALVAAACGSDSGARRNRDTNPDLPDNVGGTTGTDGTAGTSGMGGSTTVTDPPVDTVDPNAPAGPPQACTPTAPPADGVLIDPLEYGSSGTWGDSSIGHLTGGTSPYSCTDDAGSGCTDTANMTPVSDGSGLLNLSATVPPGQYTGVVLWFGPCVVPSATDWAGLSLVIGGNMAGTQLLVKPQTHVNYPVDVPNAKGACEFVAEMSKWSECVPPEFVITQAMVTAEPAPTVLAWEDFINGLPNPLLDPEEGLVGLELQFQCQAAVDCAFDVNLGTVKFATSEEVAAAVAARADDEPPPDPDPPPAGDAGAPPAADAGAP